MGFLKRFFGGKEAQPQEAPTQPTLEREQELSQRTVKPSVSRQQPPQPASVDAGPRLVFSGPWRARPIFISSTFRDVHAERDHLSNVVFPELEERLRARRYTLEPIDLRLGVETSTVAEQRTRELLVLKVCLDEIERSRPFLLVLLGDRYGWVPSEDRIAAAAQEAGFTPSDLGQSVTALEIEYGILKKDPEQRRRSLFFFREPYPYDEMPQDEAAIYSDAYSADPAVRAGFAKLEALKVKISEDPEFAGHVHSYRLDWDPERRGPTEASLNAWGKTALEALWAELDAETKDNEHSAPITAGEMEQAALDEFIQQKLRSFTGRTALLERLTKLALSPVEDGADWGACVTGKPGSGKSAIFAALYRKLIEEAPNNTLVLAHAIGSTPRAACLGDVLLRFIRELSTVLGCKPSVAEQSKPVEIEQAFRIVMRQVAGQHRVVLLLDALDQFEDDPRVTSMAWINPNWWPGNARVIATSQPGEAANALEQWAGIDEIEMPALGEAEAMDISNIIWARYHRTCSPVILASVLAVRDADGLSACASPLWLTLAMEHLNLLDADDFNRAGENIADLLQEKVLALPVDATNMYDLMFDRAEKLFGAGWARAFLGLTALGRAGWREKDYRGALLAAAVILAPESPTPDWDDLRFAALRRSFRSQLAQRGEHGRWDFTHAQMRQAVQRRYLTDAEIIRQLHGALATHLLALPEDDPLCGEEAMWHLIHANDKQRAAALLSAESLELGAINALKDCIVSTRDVQPNPAVDWALALLDDGDTAAKVSLDLFIRMEVYLSPLLEGQTSLALRHQWLSGVVRFLEERNEEFADKPNCVFRLVYNRNKLGEVLQQKGNLDEAKDHFIGNLILFTKYADLNLTDVDWQEMYAHSLYNIGNLLIDMGEYDSSMIHIQFAINKYYKMYEDFGKNTHEMPLRKLAHCFNVLGHAFQIIGRIEDAETCMRTCVDISTILLNSYPNDIRYHEILCAGYNNLSTLLLKNEDINGAEKNLLTSINIIKGLVSLDPSNIEWQNTFAVSHSNMASILLCKNESIGALMHIHIAINILKQISVLDPSNSNWQMNLCTCYHKLGLGFQAQGDFDEAEKHFRSSIDIHISLAALEHGNAGWQENLAITYADLGKLLEAKGDHDGAQEQYRQMERLGYQRRRANDGREGSA